MDREENDRNRHKGAAPYAVDFNASPGERGTKADRAEQTLG
jgi:hypothetical protein